MNLTLELSDEETARLEALATSHGVDVVQVAHEVLTAHLPAMLRPDEVTLFDIMRKWDAEDAAVETDPQNKLGLADWKQLEGDLEASRLDLPVPKT